MLVGGAGGRSTLMATGACSISRERATIGGGSVAEKNSVWRLPGQVLEDAADVGEKAHVEHPVRLVEDEDLDPLQARIRVLEVVEQPARRRDDDVGASAERGLLRPHADTAIHRGAARAA